MKSFLEEYGFGILAAVVLITLIFFATPLRNAFNKAMDDITGVNEVDNERLVQTKVYATQFGNTGMYKITIVPESQSDSFALEYRTKKDNNPWTKWKADIGTVDKTNNFKIQFRADISSGESIQMRAKDLNTHEETYYYSDIFLFYK